MDAVLFARLQFAVTVFFHFVFVPLTLGLTVLLAIMETLYVRSGKEIYKRMVQFWGKLFLINFVLGVVTGITLEFQFGTNWSRYSEYVGDIFGTLLAIEATLAFFLESTFVAVWAFGWKKVSPKTHLGAIWAVAIASNLSALWIILANGWMQHPVGYVIRNGRAELDSFFSVVTNPFAWSQFLHNLLASWALAGFFVLGISAWHLLKKNQIDFFKLSFKIAAPFTLLLVILLGLQGHGHGQMVAVYQPEKLAAMESHWDTTKNAPMYLLAWPHQSQNKNLFQAFPVPNMLSFLAFGDAKAEVKGLADFPKENQPPVLPTFLSFRLMAALGTILGAIAALAFLLQWRIEKHPFLLKIFIWAIPLPYVAIFAGWTVAEVGRQPWIVHGMMRTSTAVSPVPAY
ncbi:MAG: cytochrome ubiquinol oxidase subunit I, partial [Deltaproteobacteria bacterium]|nr:cytochrome ubiquinol oxidase subunit I [Deltaproteobacteria bacterium]